MTDGPEKTEILLQLISIIFPILSSGQASRIHDLIDLITLSKEATVKQGRNLRAIFVLFRYHFIICRLCEKREKKKEKWMEDKTCKKLSPEVGDINI